VAAGGERRLKTLAGDWVGSTTIPPLRGRQIEIVGLLEACMGELDDRRAA
jgi:hypothetical protein